MIPFDLFRTLILEFLAAMLLLFLLAFFNLRESVDIEINELLHGTSDTFVSNKYFNCWWNDWRFRDQQCSAQGTYKNCRFSKQAYILWLRIRNGRWFCCYTRHACYHLGQTLDK